MLNKGSKMWKSMKSQAPVQNETSLTSKRKQEHIKICLEKDIEFKKSNGFEKYEFVHRALPELNLAEVDTSTKFLGKEFKFPFFIEPLTGGAPGTEKINSNLARAAEEFGIGMGLGSQRAMLDEPELAYTYMVRDVAPHIFLLGNLGAVQLSKTPVHEIKAMIKEIGGDGLAVHLNAAQEICQPEGDTDWREVLPGIERVCKNTSFPVVVKETGCGINSEIAKQLESAGASCLDIAGAGGSCFTRVEYYRGAKTAEPFFEWGIPTAESLRQCRIAVKIPLIASGGIRTGVECAKALAMGASLVGFGLPLLKPAKMSYREVVEKLESFGAEFRRAMLLVGVKNIEELKKTKVMPHVPNL